MASEVGSVNVNGRAFKLSDFIKFGIVDGEQTYVRDQAIAAAEANGATTLKTAYNSTVATLDAMNDTDSDEKIVTMIVYMPTTVDNEANAKTSAVVPTINLGINLFATQQTAESDSFDNQYDKNAIIVTSAAEAQAALDAAEPGTMIKLAPSVNYGTLYFRAIPNVTPNTEYFGNAGNGNRDGYRRTLEDISIIGGNGVFVDAILFEDGAQSDAARSSHFDVKNLLIQDINFTANGGADYDYAAAGSQHFDDGDRPAILFKLNTVSFDGVTIKNCNRIGDCNYNFIRTYGHSADAAYNSLAKNLTITGCTVDGSRRFFSIYPMENLTVTNNVIKNTSMHAMHLSNYEEYVYTGTVTITGNTAYGINERFVRMAGAGNANVVIKDNNIANYFGKYDDYIKVTDSTGTVINENNPMTRAYKVSTSDELKALLATETDGVTIFLKAGDYEGLSFTNPAGYKAKNLTLVGETGTVVKGFSVNGWSADNNIVIDGLTIQNITFSSGLLLSTKSMSDVTVENCVFLNDAAIHQNDKTEKLTDLIVKNCTFSGDKNGNTTAIMLENTENLTVSGCTFSNIDFNIIQAGIISGEVLIDGNTVNGTGDRVFRFVTVNGDITISNNTIVSDGDTNGELAKTSGACLITLTGNTWNGMTDAEVADKLINIAAK